MYKADPNVKVLYRAVRSYGISFEELDYTPVSIKIEKYHVLRTTDKGYWVTEMSYKLYGEKPETFGHLPSWLKHAEKFVLDHKLGERCNRFAYKTEEDALRSFRIKTLKALEHQKAALRRTLRTIEKLNEVDITEQIKLKPFVIQFPRPTNK